MRKLTISFGIDFMQVFIPINFYISEIKSFMKLQLRDRKSLFIDLQKVVIKKRVLNYFNLLFDSFFVDFTLFHFIYYIEFDLHIKDSDKCYKFKIKRNAKKLMFLFLIKLFSEKKAT